MLVVGGTYLEVCQEPYWNDLFGSGLRAALALAKWGAQVNFHTCIGDTRRVLLETRCEEAGIELTAERIPSTIWFQYTHALSRPMCGPENLVNGFIREPFKISVTSDCVVLFGMVEANAKVDAEIAIFDPQSPGNPQNFSSNGSAARRLAIVANRSEICFLGKDLDPEVAAQNILVSEKAEVVIVKGGASGCIVVRSDGKTRIPAFRTDAVWPIGSGDIFTAAFALAWAVEKASAADAAMFASLAAANYIETRTFGIPAEIREANRAELKPLPLEKQRMVYLAAPFFNVSQRWLVEEIRSVLRSHGVKVFSPLHDVGRGSGSEIYQKDIGGIALSGVMLACLDGLDPGTIYEVGYAHKAGIPVIALVSAEREEDLKMITGGGAEMVADFTTALHLATWAATCE